MAFPCKEFVLSLSQSNLCEIIRQSTSKRISEKRIAYLTDKLIKLAKQSFCAVKKTSPMLEEVRYYAQELLRLSERRQVVLNDMVALAQPLPEYDLSLIHIFQEAERSCEQSPCRFTGHNKKLHTL